MGGGGTYYDRDVTPTRRRQTVSRFAEEVTSRRTLDAAVNPKNRKIVVEAANPFAYDFDNTGSMQRLPQVIVDKMPMICGQAVELELFEDPRISIGTFGDAITSEPAPVQAGDYALMRNADDWFKRLWLYGGGGANHRESYELMMYQRAYLNEFKGAVLPVYIITGDEGFREEIPQADLDRLFGRKYRRHEATTAEQVFADLEVKFNGNVFIVRRRYSHENDVMRQWVGLMGRGRIAVLSDDKSVGDVSLGVLALATGKYTLDQYVDSMREREQTADRISRVRDSLAPVAEWCAGRAGATPAGPDDDDEGIKDDLDVVFGGDDDWD
ncbi:hypothetical protein ACFL26_01945 [Patescibacteria group bacterium]